jgi:8-oxo-dGTP diphosphatase
MGLMNEHKAKSRVPILAAGGIVLRNNDRDATPQFAIIQSRKLQTWGLPKGKLASGEDAMAAARREVLEETGHRVAVHEFLGTLVYETRTRPKIIHFWRMEAAGAPTGDLMRDVVAVDWLTLADAIGRLSHMRERVFLEQVGPVALKLARQPAGAAPFDGAAAGILVPGIRDPGIRDPAILVQSGPLDPVADTSLSDDADDLTGRPAPAEHELAHDPAVRTVALAAGQNGLSGKELVGKRLMKKTWGWFRHAALLHRRSFD